MTLELGNGEMLARLAERGDFGAYAWELDPPHARSVAQRLRRMADEGGYVERCTDALYPKSVKFRVKAAARRALIEKGRRGG